jgi:type II secretory pathway component PulK
MILGCRHRPQGIALMIVMIAIFVLSVLAGGFAYSMKVETKLAMNARNEAAILGLGRSGVEYASCILGLQLMVAGEPYDSLNQKWAGGPGGLASSNSAVAMMPMDNIPVGDGTIAIKIKDLERRMNINAANQDMLEQALTLIGVEGGAIPAISSAILDWIDPDDIEHVNGAESDYYQGLRPPYYAKNRPMDDLSELLLIRGIREQPEIYSADYLPAAFLRVDRWGRPMEVPSYPVHLVELFTPLSSGRINVNTASATVLQLIPGVDENVAAQIIQLRSGPDGADGTDDDTPFRNVGELINAGLNRQAVQQIARWCDVRSRTFEVQVDASVGGYQRTFYAIVGRNSPRDLPILSFYWK